MVRLLSVLVAAVNIFVTCCDIPRRDETTCGSSQIGRSVVLLSGTCFPSLRAIASDDVRNAATVRVFVRSNSHFTHKSIIKHVSESSSIVTDTFRPNTVVDAISCGADAVFVYSDFNDPDVLTRLLMFVNVRAMVVFLDSFEGELENVLLSLGFERRNVYGHATRSEWTRVRMENRAEILQCALETPEDGDLYEVGALYSSMTIKVRLDDALEAFHRNYLKEGSVFARVNKDAISEVTVPIGVAALRSRTFDLTAKGKIYGSHTFSTQLFWKGSSATAFPITSIATAFFDVVVSSEILEAFEPPNTTRQITPPRASTTQTVAEADAPKVIILAEIDGFNGQLALYLEQCRRLSRRASADRNARLVQSIEWMSLAHVPESNVDGTRARNLVASLCDAHHTKPLVLSSASMSLLRERAASSSKSNDLLLVFADVLQACGDVDEMPHVLREDLKSLLSFLSTFDVVVIENERLRHIAEIARLANVRTRILQITRPEFDANYSVQALVVSSAYVLTRPTLKIAARQGIDSRVIRPGVDLRIFRREIFLEHSAHLRDRSIASPRVFRIGFVGRLVAEKSPGLVLRAAKFLRDATTNGFAFRFDVVGNGSMRADLEAAADRLGVAHMVRWIGFVSHDELPRVMVEWDVLLFPSVALETFGMVCIEAMAIGPIVVNFGIGGTRDYTKHLKTGVIADDVSGDAIARAILLLAGNRTLARHIRNEARSLVESQYAFDDYVSEHAALYRELHASGRSR